MMRSDELRDIAQGPEEKHSGSAVVKQSVEMRLFYLSIVSILAVIFSKLSGGDCTSSQRGKRKRKREERNPFDGEEPKSKKLSYAKDAQLCFEETLRNFNMMELEDAKIQGMEGPEVLRMCREQFNELGVEEKIKMTEALCANEWNELLGNFWVEGEDNARILYYTLNYDEERRLKMLEEALKENLQHLFVTISDLAYVPHTFKVIRLLEDGLKVYPNLRHWILSTIYQLGYPVTKWHLGRLEEDLNFFQDLITRGWIKREVITDHLAEILTLYPLEILNSLLAEGIMTMSDVCTIELYRGACGRGGKEYLQWAKDNCELRPDQGCIDAAVSGGYEDVVDFIAEELDMIMVPSQEAVNQAAVNGMLMLLNKKCPVWRAFPNTDGANGAAMNGNLKVLKWLAAERGVYPDQDGANEAAGNGQIKVLKWLAGLKAEESRVYPSQFGANRAARKGHLEVLEWLAALEPEGRRVYPSQHGADWAAANGQLEVLEWLATLEADEHRVYPGQRGADWAAGSGHLRVIKWLSTLEADEHIVCPGQCGADWAVENGHIEVVKWLMRRGVNPSHNGANLAVIKGNLDVLKWLAGLEPEERRAYPNQDGANWAAANGQLKALEWLAGLEPEERKVYPNQEGADRALMNGHQEVLEWLRRRGLIAN